MQVSDPRGLTPFAFTDSYPEIQAWLSNHDQALLPIGTLEDLLFEGKDDVIASLLGALPAKQRLQCWKQLAGLADGTISKVREDGKLVRLFAIPLIIVAGARQPYTLPSLLPDPMKVRALLVEHGVMDSSNHVWMSGELVDLAGLQAISASRWYQTHLATTIATQAFPFELPASSVEVGNKESVHLRFIVGIVAEDEQRQRARLNEPVGKWGVPLGQLLQSQWQKEGMTLFVMPRALTGILSGQYESRFTTLEVSFQLFASAIIRRIREGIGDPCALISVHDNAELRVSILSRLQPEVMERFVWTLDANDHIPSVLGMMQGFFAECQLSDIVFIGESLPATDLQGLPYFPTIEELDSGSASTH